MSDEALLDLPDLGQASVAHLRETLGLQLPIAAWAAEEGIANEEILERIDQSAEQRASERETLISPEQMRAVEKNFLLRTVDDQWREHLTHLDHLKNVIHLRGYGQRDPLNEYKVEAFSLYEKLRGELNASVTRLLMTVEFRFEPPPPPDRPLVEVHVDPMTGENERAQLSFAGDVGAMASRSSQLATGSLPDGWQRTGRNAQCPCGSGKKFKHCHGALV